MLAGIAECLADNGQGVIGHLLRNPVVDWAIEGDLGTRSEGGSQLVDQGQNGLTEATRERVVTEFEDGTTDFIDGGVKIIDDSGHPFSHLVSIGQPDSTLQSHAGSEQPLDHPVVECHRDPVTIIKHGEHTHPIVQPGVLDGNAGRQSKRLS